MIEKTCLKNAHGDDFELNQHWEAIHWHEQEIRKIMPGPTYKEMTESWRKRSYCYHLEQKDRNTCNDCGMALKMVDGSETPAGELIRLRRELSKYPP